MPEHNYLLSKVLLQGTLHIAITIRTGENNDSKLHIRHYFRTVKVRFFFEGDVGGTEAGQAEVGRRPRQRGARVRREARLWSGGWPSYRAGARRKRPSASPSRIRAAMATASAVSSATKLGLGTSKSA